MSAERARKLLNLAIDLSPRHKQAWTQLVQLEVDDAGARGENRRLEATLQRALREFPGEMRFVQARGFCFSLSGWKMMPAFSPLLFWAAYTGSVAQRKMLQACSVFSICIFMAWASDLAQTESKKSL